MNQRMRDLLKRKARPNKISAGMTATLERQRACGTHRGHKSTDVLMLAVYGTTDTLRPRAFGISIETAKCSCCNGTGRRGYRLTEAGQRRLRKLRQKDCANARQDRS